MDSMDDLDSALALSATVSPSLVLADCCPTTIFSDQMMQLAGQARLNHSR
jgi:hypothetical protein